MKLAFFLTFLALSASRITAQNITSWGDVHNTAIFHEERVVVPYQFFRIQNRTVTYQTVGFCKPTVSIGVLPYVIISKNVNLFSRTRLYAGSYAASCTSTIKRPTVHRQFPAVESILPLRHWTFCRNEAMELIQRFDFISKSRPPRSLVT